MFWYLVCSTYGLVALYYLYKAIRALRSGTDFDRSLLDGHRHELLLAAIPFAWALARGGADAHGSPVGGSVA